MKSFESLIIHYNEAKHSKFQLNQCVVCGAEYPRNNAEHYHRKPICKNYECRKVWDWIGHDLQEHCKDYLDALNRRLECDSLQEYINDSPLLFKNLSVRRPDKQLRVTTKKISYDDTSYLEVTQKEYSEWLGLAMLVNDKPFLYKADEYRPADVLYVDITSKYHPPISIIDKIRELASEYKLRKSLERKIESIEINLIGYCKPTKYQIKQITYEARRL